MGIDESGDPKTFIEARDVKPVWSMEKRYLTPIAPDELENVSIYDPLTSAEHGGLFKNFASLEATEEKILGFANRYGSLGAHGETVIPTEIVKSIDAIEFEYSGDGEPTLNIERKHSFPGQELSAWRSEIMNMNCLIALWESLRSAQTKTLRRAIHIDREGAILYDCNKLDLGSKDDVSYRPIKVIPDETDLLRFGHLSDTDFQAAGWIVLRKKLSENVNWRGPNIAWSGSNLRLAFRTYGLISALWLQFFQAVQGDLRYEQCLNCSSFFQVGPSAGRKGKTYCSNACRTAAYRARKEQKT